MRWVNWFGGGVIVFSGETSAVVLKTSGLGRSTRPRSSIGFGCLGGFGIALVDEAIVRKRHRDSRQHHPDFFVHWNEVRVELWTHATGGLHLNDFILAAKIDAVKS